MSDEHTHEHAQPIRYTLHLVDRHWWGGRVTMVLVGTGSSVQGNELLIRQERGIWCINFSRVRFMQAELLDDGHEHS